MTWSLLLILASIVFVNRYVFLEPKVSFKLPAVLENMLQYSAPCLLTAICVPLVFFEHDQLRNLPANPYFLGALFCIFLAVYSQKFILNLVLALLGFYLLLYWING